MVNVLQFSVRTQKESERSLGDPTDDMDGYIGREGRAIIKIDINIDIYIYQM